MFTFNFARKVRRVARRQRRRGKIDRETYKEIVSSSRNPETVIAWKAAIEKGVSGAPWVQERGDWAGIFAEIWEWFLENWPMILKIILSLMVFAEPASKPKDTKRTKLTDRKIVSKRQERGYSSPLSNITQEIE